MKYTLRSFVLASAVLATAALTVKAATTNTTLNVPFAFTVGNHTCPAGHYTVQRALNGDAVRLIGSNQSFTWVVFPGEPSPNDNRVVLKFDITGSGHALNAVQYGSLVTAQLDKKLLNQEARSSEIEMSR
jgi:hypothetical protein